MGTGYSHVGSWDTLSWILEQDRDHHSNVHEACFVVLFLTWFKQQLTTIFL